VQFIIPFAQEITDLSTEFEIIDLMACPLGKYDNVLLYCAWNSAVSTSAFNSDQTGGMPQRWKRCHYCGSDQPANIGDAETEIGAAAVGGFV